MANEITKTTKIRTTNGNLKTRFEPGTVTLDQTTAKSYYTVNAIGTSEESITDFGDLATTEYGQCVIHNLDDTNYVRVGFATGVYGIRIYPGDHAVFPLEDAADLFLIANTASCNVLIQVDGR
jgi:hypothetical protein